MELLFRVIDKRTEFFSFGVAEAVAEKFLHFSFDGTRSIAKHVLEGFVFTVQVGQEVLGSFGQVDDGFQIDDFRTGGCYGWEAA